jgi:2-C-methyl-D-erythritol 2,4-cyclodiphosphate synthase
MRIRIGQGLDVHAFGDGDHVILGGVKIPHSRGLVAHSDGDVALHALCDALLGAAALGDIGVHFPPSDPAWKDADSRVLLRGVERMLGDRGWSVINIDLTLVCESPRIKPHADRMRDNIAADVGIPRDDISIKATTTEGLGFCGRGEGIAALAAVLIQG